MASWFKRKKGGIAFVWDNLGPMHIDRCNAVGIAYRQQREVFAIELFDKSDTYQWVTEGNGQFSKITVLPGENWDTSSFWRLTFALVSACFKTGSDEIFLCHYERAPILAVALLLRLTGRRVYAMGDSKFDDYQRYIWRELAKAFFYLPYRGGLGCGIRSRDYMRFLGLKARRIKGEYNTLSIERIRSLAGTPPAPDGTPFSDRHFTIIARFVPKKNIAMALDAFALYVQRAVSPRELHLCGSGPLEAALRARVQELGLTKHVTFRGQLQSDGIAHTLGTSLALLLPSVEEQFGLVVIEAQAMGVPVLLSTNCGARDRLVRSGVNGFIIEPNNPEGLAQLMLMVSQSSDLWRKLSAASFVSANLGDVSHFVDGVGQLIAV